MRSLSTQEYIATTVAVIIAGVFFYYVYTSSGVVTAQQALQNATAITAKINKKSTANKANTQKVSNIIVTQQPTVSVQDFTTGEGETAEYGDTIYIQYVAKLDNGTIFSNSTTNPRPIEVVLKKGALLAGLGIGMINMKENGTREIVIPPELAYGDVSIANAKGDIVVPPNSTVTYDVVLLKVKKNNSSS